MSDMKTIPNLQVNVLDLDENEVSLADLCSNQATLLVFLRQFG